MRRSFWDIVYQYGDERDHWDAPRPPRELQHWLEQGFLEGRVLDVGCGTGTELTHLAESAVTRGPDVAGKLVGIDRSLVAVARARDRDRARARGPGPAIAFAVADVTQLPHRTATFDAVLDRGCLHVVSRRLRSAYAREVARVTRSGGRLLLRGARRPDEDAGLESLPRREIHELFSSHGFTQMSVDEIRMEARAGDLEAWAYCFLRT